MVYDRPSWWEPVTYAGEKLQAGLSDSEKSPYIVGDLEMIPHPSDQKTLLMPHPRRPIGPLSNCALGRQWPDYCDRHPENTARFFAKFEDHAKLFRGDGFRLIDILQGRLVQVTEPCGYIALSYVWGQAAQTSLRASLANIDGLSTPGALVERPDGTRRFAGKRVPGTVADAMQFVRGLGYRYLWIDALCILQDDVDDRRRLIHGMGQIYEKAICTIVDAAGIDADCGFYDVRPRQHLPYETVFQIGESVCVSPMVMARPPLVDAVKKARWHTRGWTYQEVCLSPRSFFFTPGFKFLDNSGLDPLTTSIYSGKQGNKENVGLLLLHPPQHFQSIQQQAFHIFSDEQFFYRGRGVEGKSFTTGEDLEPAPAPGSARRYFVLPKDMY